MALRLSLKKIIQSIALQLDVIDIFFNSANYYFTNFFYSINTIINISDCILKKRVLEDITLHIN